MFGIKWPFVLRSTLERERSKHISEMIRAEREHFEEGVKLGRQLGPDRQHTPLDCGHADEYARADPAGYYRQAVNERGAPLLCVHPDHKT